MSLVNPELYKEYKRLADRADKRLLRLERLAKQHPDTYGNVLAYAYKGAQKSIEYWDKKPSNKPRFARNTPKTAEEMKQKMADIQDFLRKPTSSKVGIDQTYKNKAESLNKKFKTDFTWEEWARFGIRGYWDRKDGRYTYNEMIKVSKVQKSHENVIMTYDKLKRRKPSKYNLDITSDNFLNDLQNQITNELNTSKLISDDLNTIQKSLRTIFETKKNIVFKETQKLLNQNGLDYNTMFK